jgi:hypothetical protein
LGISGGADETTTTTSNDLALASVVDTVIIDEIRPYMVMRNFFRTRPGGASSSFDFPLQDDPGVAGSKVEGVDLNNTALTTSKATATAGTVGIMATVTDELTAISLIDALPHFQEVLTRSVAEKFETDAVALIDDFSNTTGTSGADYTWAQRQEAIGQLASRDAVGTIVEALHPQQVFDLRQDLTTSTAAIWGNENVVVNGMMASELGGYVFTAFGVPTYQTSLVNTANGGADRAGGMFVADLSLGLYEIWGTKVERQRDASNVATEIVVTARYGMIEVRDSWAESIITDA